AGTTPADDGLRSGETAPATDRTGSRGPPAARRAIRRARRSRWCRRATASARRARSPAAARRRAAAPSRIRAPSRRARGRPPPTDGDRAGACRARRSRRTAPASAPRRTHAGSNLLPGAAPADRSVRARTDGSATSAARAHCARPAATRRPTSRPCRDRPRCHGQARRPSARPTDTRCRKCRRRTDAQAWWAARSIRVRTRRAAAAGRTATRARADGPPSRRRGRTPAASAPRSACRRRRPARPRTPSRPALPRPSRSRQPAHSVRIQPRPRPADSYSEHTRCLIVAKTEMLDGAADYWTSRLIFERALALIYLTAFVCAANQFVPLVGERGLLPAVRFIRAVPFRAAPGLFYLAPTDAAFRAAAWAGIALSCVAISGIVQRGLLSGAIWAAMWLLYLSFVNVGQTFYAFGWESLLLEAGFFAVFLGGRTTAPSMWVIWIFRWIL